MPAYTIVGVSTLASAPVSGGTTFTVSLPTGTTVGDILVLAGEGGGSYSTTDSRMTFIDGGTAPCIFTGTATSLGSIAIHAAYSYSSGHLYLVAVRGPRNRQRYGYRNQLSEGSIMAGDLTGPFPETATDFALCFSFDDSISPDPSPTMGDDPGADWTSLTSLPITYSAFGSTFHNVARAYYLNGPVDMSPPLWVPGTTYRRISSTVYWRTIDAGNRHYLRQRQGPRGNAPRVDWPTTLRQRQRPT